MRAQLFLILAISLAGCNSVPTLPSSSSAPIVGPVVPVGQSEIRDLGPSTETVWNCGSGGGTVVKHPSMSVATNWAVEWEVGGTAGTGIHIGDGVIPGGVDLSASLEGHYANKFDQSIQQGTGWDLPAEPNTVVVYTLMWREIWQPGYVDVRLANQSVVKVNVRYRTGIQSEIVGKQQQSCGAGQQTSQPITTPRTTSVTQLLNHINRFRVIGNTPKNRTEVWVNVGDTIYVEYLDGQWTGEKGRQPLNTGCGFYFDDAYSSHIYPLDPKQNTGAALIGYIGNQPFLIGCKSFNSTATTSGELYLGMNDCQGCFWDNDGEIYVRISITRK